MKCFLCEKDNVEMSLEHSIPQFLGGKKSDDKFKKLNLCRSCNSGLGTHVDARFARSFINAMELIDFNGEIFFGRSASIEFEENDEIHDLISDNQYIEMLSNDKSVAFWMKNNTEEFLGLIGGHAPLSKSKPSKLFLFITKKDINEDEMKELLYNIRLYFKKYNKLEILLCLDFTCGRELNGQELDLFKSDIRNRFCVKGVKLIWEFTECELRIKERLKPDGKNFKSNISFNLNDDIRFLTKLFLGVLCGYLGNEFTKHPVGLKLISILRTYITRSIPSEEDMNRLKHPFQIERSNLFLSEENAITISILQIRQDVLGLLSIGKNMYSLKICNQHDLSEDMKNFLNIKSSCCIRPEGWMLILRANSDKYLECDVKKFFLEKMLKEKYPQLSETQKLMILNQYA